MEYNEKVERFAPKLGRKNLANGLSCPPFVYMDYSDDGMWVHYGKYCENIAKQKYKRCLAKKEECKIRSTRYHDLWEKWRKTEYDTSGSYYKDYIKWWHRAMKWLDLAEKFKEAK
jgi:hypothetical protein